MAKHLTKKQTLFIEIYLRTGNASEAYRTAYDAEAMSQKSVWREAHTMLHHPKVAPRIRQATVILNRRIAELIEKLALTEESQFRRLEYLFFDAMVKGDYSRAVKAVREQNILMGFRPE